MKRLRKKLRMMKEKLPMTQHELFSFQLSRRLLDVWWTVVGDASRRRLEGSRRHRRRLHRVERMARKKNVSQEFATQAASSQVRERERERERENWEVWWKISKEIERQIEKKYYEINWDITMKGVEIWKQLLKWRESREVEKKY